MRKLKLGIIVLVLTLQLPSFAQDRHNIQRIAYWGANWGDISDIEIQGDYAYLATSVTGVRIVDRSDPRHPEEVSFFDIGGASIAVEVEGDGAGCR